MKKNLLYLLVLHVVGPVAAPSIVHADLITTWVTPAQSVQAGASFEVVVMTANRGDTNRGKDDDLQYRNRSGAAHSQIEPVKWRLYFKKSISNFFKTIQTAANPGGGIRINTDRPIAGMNRLINAC